MRYGCSTAVLVAISALAPGAMFGQGSSALSITDYQLISQQQVTRTQSNFTYRADLVNTGVAQPALTAIVTSKIASISVVPGQSKLHFPPVPANGRVTSTNTFTVLVDRSLPSDFSNLVWIFGAPVANAGPDQSAPVGTLVTLDGSKSTNPSGIGGLTYDWIFSSRPPGTRAVLQNADTPMPSFTADVQGDFVLTLTVTNGVGSDRSTVTVHVGPATARKPTANAGPGQTVKPGATVTLNGSGSSDPDGNPLTYRWTLIVRPAGSTAVLRGANTVSPSFVADKPGIYMAQLIVNNGSLDSDASTVTITDVNTRPVANAGPGQSVNAGALVQLDGSRSTDADGNPLTYRWTLNSVPAGSTAVLNNPTGVNPTFIADVAGVYIAQLIVNDGFDDSDPSTVTITASTTTPQKPTAFAGLPQSLKHGSVVTLNGSGTDPQGKPLTFRWALISKPAGSTATLSNPNSQSPTFTADLPGNYIAQLIVNNGSLDSDPSTVTISSSNTAPVANAGPNQSVAVGTKVTLDGSASLDAEHDPLTYSWSLSSVPSGSTASLTFPTSANPTFVADVAVTYVAQLIVNDGFLNSAPATVTITAISRGLVLAPNPLNLFNVPGTLTVTIASPAGPSGQVVKLTSLDLTVVTVPDSVTIAPNTTSVSFTVTPVGKGSTNVFASAQGFQPGSATVNVTQPPLTLSLSSNSVGVSHTVTGTVRLNAPASAGGVMVNLTADKSGIVTIPPSLTIAGGSTTGTFTVTGAAPGSVNITASSPGYTSSAAAITVGQLGQITLQSNVTVGPGQTLPFAVTLVSPAPSGGVNVNLVSSDPSKLTITPNVFFSAGATTPDSPAQISGVNFGSATVTASAPGFTGDTKTVQIAANLSFTPASLTIGVGGSQNLTLTLSGPAPAGGVVVNLSSSNTNAATGPQSVTIQQGTTTVNVPVTGVTSGQSTTITATSSTPGVVSATANVSVIPGVVISTTTLLNGATNTPYNATVTASGGTKPYTFTATGLPAGLSISPSGQITGTTTATGTFTVAVTVTDSTSPKLTANANLTLIINQALAITTTTLPTGTVNTQYSAPPVAATGGTTPYTFTATGLPAGLSISPTGQITGASTAAGNFTVAVTVTDSTNPKLTATANLTLTINSALAITTSSLPGGTLNIPYSAPPVTATGGTTHYTFTAAGLPAGLSISPAGQISGTPTAAGTFTVAVTVTDSTSPTPLSSNTNLTLTIAPPTLVLTTTTLPNGTVNVSYSATVTASGGTTPYNFTATGLPAGLSINAAGQVSGTPTAAGTFNASVTVTDSSNPAQSKTGNVTITIAPPPLVITTTSLPNGVVGVQYSAPVNASGGVQPSSFGATGLPPGLAISMNGQITGTPTAAGTFNTAITVADSNNPRQTANANLSITIAPQTSGPSVTITGGAIGQNLQIPITVTLTTPAPSSLNVSVSSDNSNVLFGSASQGGNPSFNVTVPEGSTSFTTFAKALTGSGSATLTAMASGYNTRTSNVTLTPSGFVIAGVNGVGGNVNVNQGSTAPLTISAAQLDSSGNFGQIEQLRGGLGPVAVTLSNSNPNAGNVSPASLNFTAGTDSLTSQFTASSSSTSSTVVTVNVPAGFSTPATGNSVVISVQPASIIPDNVTVGQGLETTAGVSLQGTAPTDLQVVLTSNDDSKVLLSLDGVSAGMHSITTKIGAGRSRMLDFYVYGVGNSGTSGYTAMVTGFGTANGVVTLGRTGFILASPFGNGADFFTTTLSPPTDINVFTALLDSSGNPVTSQDVAGGTTINVNVTSSPTSVGTITTSPVTFTGGPGSAQATTQFQPVGVGTATITAIAPAGFATPAKDASLHATVSRPRVVVKNIDTLGNNLEQQATLFLSAPAPAGGVTVTLQSSDASLLQFSSTATGAGSGTLTIPIAAGQSGATYFVYGKSNGGSPTYTGTATGYDSSSAQVNLAPTGIIIIGPSGPGFEFDTSVASGPSPLSISTAVLDPSTSNFVQTQPLQGGASVTVSVTSSSPGVGTVTSPVTITSGNDTANSQFTPVSAGQTTVSVARPLNFSPPTNDTTLLVKVQ